MKDSLIKGYNNLKRLNFTPKIKPKIHFHFVKGGFVEILGGTPSKFLVQFFNKKTEEIIYEDTLTNNMWSKVSLKYFIDYAIKVKDLNTGEEIVNYMNLKDKRVFITLDSSAIGDTLAWFPYIEEFRKKHKCQIICSTFHSSWFESEYPEIEFVKPGTVVENLYAMYTIGWYYDEDKVNFNHHPQDFRKFPLQETATQILGMPYKEIKPKLSFKNTGPTIEGKYVVIAPHASAHAKYWNRPNGWQEIVDYLNKEGYKVVMITKEKLGDPWHDSKLGGTLKGVIDKTGDFPLEDRANDIMNAEFFIGVGSGLSWLSWALGTKTILISGFSEEYTEFQECERIAAPIYKCRGCFNKSKLDAGDWEWCPVNKNTPQQFECTKSISPETVIESIERIRKT